MYTLPTFFTPVYRCTYSPFPLVSLPQSLEQLQNLNSLLSTRQAADTFVFVTECALANVALISFLITIPISTSPTICCTQSHSHTNKPDPLAYQTFHHLHVHFFIQVMVAANAHHAPLPNGVAIPKGSASGIRPLTGLEERLLLCCERVIIVLHSNLFETYD